MEIEKNIPIPNKRGKWRTLLKDMQIGDSVLIKRESEHDVDPYSQSCAIVYAFKNDGWKFVRRNLKPLGEPSEIRVWRIK